MGGQDVTTLILSARHDGFSLFPVNEWPCMSISRVSWMIPFSGRYIYTEPGRNHRMGDNFRTIDEADAHAKKFQSMSFLIHRGKSPRSRNSCSKFDFWASKTAFHDDF